MFGFSDDFTQWSPGHFARAKQHIEVYKQIRHLLWGDFYPLFPLPSSLQQWDGWQYHDPATGEGAVIAFRVQSPQGVQMVPLHGLDRSRQYIVTDPYKDGVRETRSGAYLSDTGMPIAAPKNGSVVLQYRAV